MSAAVPDAIVLAEAVALMDPPMPLRTLQSRVRKAEEAGELAHVSYRKPGSLGGRPGREYRASDLFSIHRKWVLSTQGKKTDSRSGVAQTPAS